MSIMVAAVFALTTVSAFAVGEDVSSFDLAAVMTTAVQSMVNDLIKMMTAVIPIGLTVLGVSVGVTMGKKWIKKLLNS